MVAIGVALAWAGYTVGLWGYCLVKSYDVTFTELFANTWPGAQVSQTGPAAGRQLGTITNSTQVTDPGQLASEQGSQ